MAETTTPYDLAPTIADDCRRLPYQVAPQDQKRFLRTDDCNATPAKRRCRTDCGKAAVSEKKEKRLVLVLDLDHTLVHTIRAAFLTDQEAGLLRLFKLRDTDRILTKLRPFVRTFLREVRAMYDLRVCTKGGRDYARRVVRALDPQGVYFGPGHIIAREDLCEKNRKNLDIVPGAHESAAVIVDDTVEVWEHHLENLVSVRPYSYFSHHGYPEEKSHAETGTDEEEQVSGGLENTLGLLRQVHETFHSLGADGDVRDVLRLLRKKPELNGAQTSDDNAKPRTA